MSLLAAADPAPALEAPDPAPVPPDGPAGETALTCLAALLAAAAFAWLAGAVFAGLAARLAGLAGASLGVGAAALSTRSRRPAAVQYAGAAVVVAAGALLVLPDVRGGSTLPSLVLEALRGGGLSAPPVPFDPGWRFVLVVLSGLTGQAVAGLALGLRRPRLAPLTVLPLVLGAALLQAPGTEVGGTLVALLLLVGSLAVALGTDLGAEGTSTAFELRRLGRGAAALAALGALLGGAAQLGFLFPAASTDRVIPPMRPQLPPATPDRVLFTVNSAVPLTWRLGTLDVYRSPAWLTPPFDPARLVRLPRNGAVPPAARGETRGAIPNGATVTATFTLAGLTGKTLPALADPTRVTGGPAVTYDPRTQSIRLAGTRAGEGTRYLVTAPAPPSGAALAAAGPPDPAALPFLSVPPAPPEVAALLATAPANPFARLQFVRRAYFAHVVAAGGGRPVDVPPGRVVQLLQGQPGSPYEITAAEVLLARWAGVPARLGYGYYGGEPAGPPGTVAIRPRNGATWLEAYFHGSGWVPIVGTPPRAQQALDTHQQNADPSVRASEELALVVYVPIRTHTVQLLYVAVRYYVARAIPAVLAVLALLGATPAALRGVRRIRRRRAARRLGPAAQVAAAYAELRDTATDLAISTPAASPMELVDVLGEDTEHRELAWLVTRSLWGDLQRDLQPDDVQAAEELSRSVARRLRRAQPGFSRLAALLSTASLRRPWTTELPGGWLPPRSRRFVLPAVAAVLAAALALAALAGSPPPPPAGPSLPGTAAPPAFGDVRLVPEPEAEQAFHQYRRTSLAADARVFSLHQGAIVQGSLQLVGLLPGLDTRSARVREQVLQGLGAGRFQPARLGEERVYRADLPEQELLLSFSPDGRSYYLMVARRLFGETDQVFASLLAFRRGKAVSGLARLPDVPVPDPRIGAPE